MPEVFRTARQVLRVLPRGASRFYMWFVVVSSSLAILDVISMSLFALVMSPVMSGQPITLPLLGTFSTELAVWLVVAACALIIVKGILAIALQWVATRRFAKYEMGVGNDLLEAYTQLSWDDRSAMTTSDVTRAADTGIANTVMGFLLPLASIPGNVLSFLAVAIVLVFSQPLGALLVTVYLVLIGLLLFAVISKKTLQAGRVSRDFGYRAAAVITELVEALKEVTLRNRVSDARDTVYSLRVQAVRARANISFLSIVPKYVIEAALIGGILIVGAVAYIQADISEALVAVALFGVTGFRMVPALTGIQSSLTMASANLIYAKDLLRDITSFETEERERLDPDTMELPENPKMLALRDISFRYPGGDRDVLDGVTLTIPLGSSLGVAGPSGAGKSTLIDVLLGLNAPGAGTVEIDGVPIAHSVNAYRELVSYVPQHVAIIAGSLAQNVALTWGDDFDGAKVERALRRAQLGDLLDSYADGIHTQVEERGGNLSGGQRQRLGIARALYSDPLILVLDEATSALDGKTESEVTEAIAALEGDVTVIAIAHRLATIRGLDRVCYLDKGKVLGYGTFDELRKMIPAFDEQANRAGLSSPSGQDA